jgi:hypothetical protein
VLYSSSPATRDSAASAAPPPRPPDRAGPKPGSARSPPNRPRWPGGGGADHHQLLGRVADREDGLQRRRRPVGAGSSAPPSLRCAREAGLADHVGGVSNATWTLWPPACGRPSPTVASSSGAGSTAHRAVDGDDPLNELGQRRAELRSGTFSVRRKCEQRGRSGAQPGA